MAMQTTTRGDDGSLGVRKLAEEEEEEEGGVRKGW